MCAANIAFKPADFITPPSTPRHGALAADQTGDQDQTPSPFKRFEKLVKQQGPGVPPPEFNKSKRDANASLQLVKQEKQDELVSRLGREAFSRLSPENHRSPEAHRQAFQALSNFPWVAEVVSKSGLDSVINAKHVFDGEKNHKGERVGKHYFSQEERKAVQIVVPGGMNGVYAVNWCGKWSTCFPEKMDQQDSMNCWIDATVEASNGRCMLKKLGDFWTMGYYQSSGVTATFFPLFYLSKMVPDQAAYRITDNVIVQAESINAFIKRQIGRFKRQIEQQIQGNFDNWVLFKTAEAYYVDIGPTVADKLCGLNRGVLIQVPLKK